MNAKRKSDKVKIRLTLDVAYELNGENAVEVMSCLRRRCERAIGEGLLTGELDTEVEEDSLSVVIVPDPLPETEMAEIMAERVENIVTEMRERIDGNAGIS